MWLCRWRELTREGGSKTVAVLICSKDKHECTAIGENCRECVAKLSDKRLDLSVLPADRDLEQVAETEKAVNLLYYDFKEDESVSGLRLIKKRDRDIMVMMIAEETSSPLSYLKPGIAPDALLLRPIRQNQLDEINREFIQSYFDREESGSVQDSFLVDTREEKTVVPYSHIYYFEAREKKLFLRTRYEEHMFYGTIDALEKKLPPTFRRCHRSYIVNLKKLVKIVPGENYLELADRITLPVSRSYKNSLKEGLL